MDPTKKALHEALTAYLAKNWPGNQLANDPLAMLEIPVHNDGSLKVPILILENAH